MKKTSLTRALFVAGAVAMAGAAQADAIFYPDGSMVDLGSDVALEEGSLGDTSIAMTGTCETCVDTTVLGAGPSKMTTTTTTTAPVVRYEYVQPNINWDRATVVSQMHLHKSMASRPTVTEKQAAATFDVPQRAGEASTMTGGAPNMSTDNNTFIVGGTVIPHSSITVGQPYYVMSW